jgi:predicted transcriptional regulator
MVKMKMKTNEIRHIPIVKSNKVVGIITHRDLEKVQEDSNLKASDVMTEDPFTVQKSALLKDVVFYMSNKKIGSALVVGSNDELYGIFTSIDALNSIIEMA